MEQTRSQRFIQEYARLMKSSAEFFNKDSVLMSREDYENAKLRVLVVFPSPASTKAVSMTAAVLNDYVISSCPGVFIDFAYVPEQDDLKYYDKANMPYAIGNVTHLDASHFDIVGFSISILFESISVAWIMNSFTRCDKPLPLTWSERKDKKLSEVPVFYAGGITCSVADILFGELGDGRQAFLDYLHLGEFHCSKLLFDHYLVSREKGRTVQEMIDSFWKEVDFNDWLYQPQAYQVEFNDKNQIVKNVKINPNAPDMCKPYYPDEMPKEIGAARGIVMGNGVNAGLGQILAANGCSRSGFCNFSVAGNTMLGTVYGLISIENLVDKGCQKLQSAGVVTCKDILRQKDERVYRVTLESGVYLDCSSGHKWIRAIDHKKGNKEKTYTTRQLSNIINKGGEFVVLRKIGNHFGVEWHSDLKVINLREESMLSQDEKCYQYTVSSPYNECCEMINDLVVRLNFYGFDTGVLRYQDKTIIEWWPMPNCATYDRVVAVEALAEVVPMYDVFDTDDHTVCYNGIVTHQCYAEDTLVTTDRGLVRISDLRVGDKVDGGEGNFESVTAKFDTGVQDVLKFTFDDGNELRVTFDHNLLDSEGKDKKAKDFKVGDFVYFKPHYCDSGINFDGRILYIAGYFLGDGSYEKHKYSTRSDCGVSGVRWYFSRGSQGVSNMKLVESVLEDLGVEYFVEDNAKNTTVRLISREQRVIDWILEIVGNKERLTDFVLSLDRISYLWFMSGVITSDGTVDSKLGHIRLGMSRKELILDMYRKLQQFNMATKVDYYSYKQPESSHPRFSKYSGRVIKKWRILFSLKDNEKFANAQITLFGEGKQEVKKARKTIVRKQKGKIVSIEVEEKVQCYNLTVEPNHKLVVQGNICSSNCHEGSYTGGWVENTPERLVELAKLCRKHTASTTLKAYSFNSNYLSDYKRNIYDWLGVYPRVTFNNMRLEELGLDKDALKMMKLAGYQRMTAPLEGISERIRNNLLNKNLSEKALDSYLEYGMMMGAVDCKVGIVLTGYEEEQDWQAFYDFNMKWRKKCHDMGGNIPFRYKCTLLVHYPHTPVEFLERRAARHAFYGTYIMPNEWNEKYYADHIRIKLNGFKHSTFIEQAIVDLGRYATSWMYNYIIRPGYPFYNTKTIVTHEEAWEAFRAMINPDYFFNERKMDEYISICHRIHIAMHANVIFQAKKILKDGANATPTIRCLKTYEGCPVDCKAHVYEKSPLTTFGDAWLDESGKLTGKVWEEVKGCQRCKTPADRKKVLARELPMSKNADDILMYKAPSLELRLRFRIQRKKEYEVLSPRNTAFVFFTKFLRKSDDLCEMFWELDAYHNMFWQSEEDKTYLVSGQQIVDVTFTDRKAKEIVESLIQEVNAEANSFRVVSVREVPLTDKIKVDDFNVFYFESTLSAEFWQFAAMNYDGEVKVEGNQGTMETIKDVRLKAPSFTLRDKVKGYFTVPCKYSPWHYLQGLMAVRRISLSKLLATTTIKCVTTVRESNVTCMCGKEKAVSDLGTNLQQKVGRECLTSLLTSKL